jgi:hypothetical protein
MKVDYHPIPGAARCLHRSRGWTLTWNAPHWFHGLHNNLITYIEEQLQPRLPNPYYAQSGERVSLEVSQRFVKPDVDIMRERRASAPSRRFSGQGGIAIAEPELETELQASHAVLITVEDVVHDEHIEPFLEIRGRWSGQDRLVATLKSLLQTASAS